MDKMQKDSLSVCPSFSFTRQADPFGFSEILSESVLSYCPLYTGFAEIFSWVMVKYPTPKFSDDPDAQAINLDPGFDHIQVPADEISK